MHTTTPLLMCTLPCVRVAADDAARAHSATLADAGIGLLICDEGHRLKATGGNATIDALRRIGKARRVILTGTPMQNDLKEFWALADFVAHGELGSLASFSQTVAAPIDAGRQPGASAAACEAAEAATARLRTLSESFVHRRDASVLATILPPRSELALFCRLSPNQHAAYAAAAQAAADGAGDQHVFAAISQLRRIISAPDELPTDFSLGDASPDEQRADKLALLLQLLEPLHASGEKVVVCSGFGYSLDRIEAAVRLRGWGVCRLDGSTPRERRQELVDRFNRVPRAPVGSADASESPFVFLLSTRAGGVGFNLVGASRLVLYDPDWNPSMDVQAMARVYRQGQTRPVVIWRLFGAGTVEERMYMRQLFKSELNAALADGGDEGAPSTEGSAAELRQSFGSAELRQLFEYDGSNGCLTLHELLRGAPERAAAMSADDVWRDALPDEVLRTAATADPVVRQALLYAVDTNVLEQLCDETDARHRAAVADDEDELDETSEHVARSTNQRGNERISAAHKAAGRRCGAHSVISDDEEEEIEYEMDQADRAFIVDDDDSDELVEGGEGGEDEDEDEDDKAKHDDSDEEEDTSGVAELEMVMESDDDSAARRPVSTMPEYKRKRGVIVDSDED